MMMNPKSIRAAELVRRIEAKLDRRPALALGISLLSIIPLIIAATVIIDHPLAAALTAAGFGGVTLIVAGVRSNRADRVGRREAEERFTQHVQTELDDENLAWTVWRWTKGMEK